jgi:hypothetical protein
LRKDRSALGNWSADFEKSFPVDFGLSAELVVGENLLPGCFDAGGPEEDGETGFPAPEFPLCFVEPGFYDGMGVRDRFAGTVGLPEIGF